MLAFCRNVDERLDDIEQSVVADHFAETGEVTEKGLCLRMLLILIRIADEHQRARIKGMVPGPVPADTFHAEDAQEIGSHGPGCTSAAERVVEPTAFCRSPRRAFSHVPGNAVSPGLNPQGCDTS